MNDARTPAPQDAVTEDVLDDDMSEEPRAEELFARLPGDQEAREQLVLMFRPLATYLARKFRGHGESMEDLEQVASLALIKAVDRFDPARGVKFSTYATATIVGEIKRHFRDKAWALRVPRRLQEMGLQVSRAVADLYQEYGRSPTIKQLSEVTGLTEEEVIEAMDTVHAYATVSLDAPVDSDGGAAIDSLGAEDEAIELTEAWASLAPAIDKLPPRERRILYLRFFRGQTQTQIADELGISQMHVSRLIARILGTLREELRAG